MKPRQWSLAIILILINYLIFARLFTQLVETDFNSPYATRTPIPTFTPAPVEPFIIVPTLTPAPIVPTATATRVLSDGNEASSNSVSEANNSSDRTADRSPSEGQAQVIKDGYIPISLEIAEESLQSVGLAPKLSTKH